MLLSLMLGVYNRQRFWGRRTELAQQMAKLARRLSDRQTGLLRPNRLSLGISPVYLPVNTLSWPQWTDEIVRLKREISDDIR